MAAIDSTIDSFVWYAPETPNGSSTGRHGGTCCRTVSPRWLAGKIDQKPAFLVTLIIVFL
jgi:hypothetical protein